MQSFEQSNTYENAKGILRTKSSLILVCGPTKEIPKVFFDPYIYILFHDFILPKLLESYGMW